ncbi:MAG: hypothetical protein DDT31_00637 [Syntrophomonadaceae bacterium]|nr:hypothetical protein [Bacillota bacterium]
MKITTALKSEKVSVEPIPFHIINSQSINYHCYAVQGIDVALIQRVQSLINGVEIDLEAPLSVDDE